VSRPCVLSIPAFARSKHLCTNAPGCLSIRRPFRKSSQRLREFLSSTVLAWMNAVPFKLKIRLRVDPYRLGGSSMSTLDRNWNADGDVAQLHRFHRILLFHPRCSARWLSWPCLVPLTMSRDRLPRSSFHLTALHADLPSTIDPHQSPPPSTGVELNVPTPDVWNACGPRCLLTKRKIHRAGATSASLNLPCDGVLYPPGTIFSSGLLKWGTHWGWP
jgi:hypothetical protein